jgi:DNA-binding NtrC family response regulator
LHETNFMQSCCATPLSNKPLLLIVDDDPLISDALSHAFAAEFDVVTSHARPHCLALLRQLRQPPQLALVDLGLPPLPHRPDEGFALIGDLLAHAPDMKIIVLSGQNGEDNARHARTLGAVEFVGKPCDPGRLLTLLRQALAFADGAAQTAGATAADRRKPADAAPAPAARAIRQPRLPGADRGRIGQRQGHRRQPLPAPADRAPGQARFSPSTARRSRPAWSNRRCSAMPRAPSPAPRRPRPAISRKPAKARCSSTKSANCRSDLQPKLLRVLENGEYQRVGETQTRTSKARIVAATNRDLRQEIKAGRFRADLYHRLSVFTVSVPPLRDMGRDRLLLLDHFRRLYAAQAQCQPFALAPDAEALWLGYGFPGNVRELRNIVIRLTARHPGQAVTAGQLLPEFDASDEVDRSGPAGGGREQSRTAHAGRPQASADGRAHRPRRDARRLGAQLHRSRLELCAGNVSQRGPPPRHQPHHALQPHGKLAPFMSLYLEHFGLREPPFRITPHTDFFFTGANRGPTLDALIYAITQDEGIVKVTGEVGSGKTMLCRMLLERLPADVESLYLANPSLSRTRSSAPSPTNWAFRPTARPPIR